MHTALEFVSMVQLSFGFIFNSGPTKLYNGAGRGEGRRCRRRGKLRASLFSAINFQVIFKELSQKPKF